MFNTQIDITTKLTECLQKCIILNKKLLKNLINIVIGMIVSMSSIPSDIAPELKTSYSSGLLPSVVKRIQRFFYSTLNVPLIYYYFIEYILEKYKPCNNRITLIFDHTTCDDRFVVLKFAMKINKRAIPLWFKICKYSDDDAYSREYVKDGVQAMQELFAPYDYRVKILADRGFRDMDLFGYIRACGFNFAIRVAGDTNVKIKNRKNIKKLRDIRILLGQKKLYKNVKLFEDEFLCNIAVAVNEEDGDVWYIVTDMSPITGLREYCKRFQIEEMFKDFKSNGFNLEATRTNNLTYFTSLYMCICIGYVWIITLGASCSKDKKNKEIGAIKTTNDNKVIRIYSLFKTGLKWFKLCYYSEIDRYLKCDFVLYGT